MKKAYPVVAAILFVICVVEGYAIFRLVRQQKSLPDNVAGLADKVGKGSEDFDRYFDDDFFRSTADPFKEMERVRKQMRSMMLHHTMDAFDDSWEGWFKGRFGGPNIAVTTEQNKDAVVMRIRIPGMQKNNLNIAINNDCVKIECDISEVQEVKDPAGNISSRSSSRQRLTRIFSLPQGVDASKAVTNQEKDEIIITLPKAASAGI